MTIISSGYHGIREEAVNYITAHKQQGDYRVLDVGGAAGGDWYGLRDAVLDIQPKADIVGDICYPYTWNKVSLSGPWDFMICCHTLEDIRDPYYPIWAMRTVAKAGLIIVPNKHTELATAVESGDYVGYGHHRWIFTLQHDVFRAMAKWPIVNVFRDGGRLGPQGLPWLDASKRGGAGVSELSFIWEDNFDFEFINGDFAGLPEEGTLGIIKAYQEKLAEGL